jgi:hypothetical protein
VCTLPGWRRAPQEEWTMTANEDIVGLAMENSSFRRVIETGEHCQIVVMSIPPGGETARRPTAMSIRYWSSLPVPGRRSSRASGPR